MAASWADGKADQLAHYWVALTAASKAVPLDAKTAEQKADLMAASWVVYLAAWKGGSSAERTACCWAALLVSRMAALSEQMTAVQSAYSMVAWKADWTAVALALKKVAS